MTVLARIKKGVAAEASIQILRTIFVLIEMPLALYAWGAQKYSEWLVIFTLPTFVIVFSSSFVMTGARLMTKSTSASDEALAKNIFGNLIFFSMLIAIACLLVGFLVSGYAWFNAFSFVKEASNYEVALCVFSVFVYMLIGVCWSVIAAPITARLRYDLVSYNGALSISLESLLFFLIMMISNSIFHAALGYLIGRLISLVILYAMMKRVWPGLSLKPVMGSRSDYKEIFMPAMSSLCITLANVVNSSGMRYVVASSMNGVAVVSLVAARTATRLIFQVINSVKKIAEPELASAYGKKDFDLARKAYFIGMNFTFLLGFVFSVIMVSFWPILQNLWLSDRINIDRTTILCFCFVAILNGLWMYALSILNANSKQGYVAMASIFGYGILPILATLLLTQIMGFQAILVGLTLGELAMMYSLIYVLNKHIDSKIGFSETVLAIFSVQNARYISSKVFETLKNKA